MEILTKQSDDPEFVELVKHVIAGCVNDGFPRTITRSFTSARSDAGLKDVRFHDLRHTAATRLVGAHIPLSEVGRVLGHTQANTTYRYVNANLQTARRAAAALNMFNSEDTAEPESAEMVN